MKITELTKRNIIFTVPENNEGGYVHMGLILGEKHNFIIDTGMGESNIKAIRDYIGNDTKPIITIITHAHCDHFFGNSALRDGIIVSHVLCHKQMDEEWDTKTQDHIKKRSEFIDSKIHKCLPNVTFEGNMHFPDDGISIFHTPGHTDGCICVYDAVGKVLYTGDSFGVSEGRAYLWTNYNHEASAQLIEIYKKCDFEICVPSHSEPQTKEVITLLEAAYAEEKEVTNAI